MRKILNEMEEHLEYRKLKAILEGKSYVKN